MKFWGEPRLELYLDRVREEADRAGLLKDSESCLRWSEMTSHVRLAGLPHR